MNTTTTSKDGNEETQRVYPANGNWCVEDQEGSVTRYDHQDTAEHAAGDNYRVFESGEEARRWVENREESEKIETKTFGGNDDIWLMAWQASSQKQLKASFDPESLKDEDVRKMAADTVVEMMEKMVEEE